MKVADGDWIITGVNGEHYPCKHDIFEKTYSPVKGSTGLTFGETLEAMKAGKRVSRAGWNGKGMFAYYVPAARYTPQTSTIMDMAHDDGLIPYRAYLALNTAQGDVATWAPSSSDCLAEDWEILP